MQKNNILITGGAGFIGSHLALRLTDIGYNVTVLDNLSPQIHVNQESSFLFQSIKSKVNFIQGDVRDKSIWNKVIRDQHIIIHLAAETGTGQSMYEIEKYVDVNCHGTAIMLDYLANNDTKVEKVIVASSRAVYGEGKYRCEVHDSVYPLARRQHDMLDGLFECRCPICDKEVSALPTDEKAELHPSSIYGITKLTQEQLVLTACKSMGISGIAFRFQNVYGPGQSLQNPYTGILSIFSSLINNNRNINIYEDGKESRDFIYISDVIESLLLGAEYDGKVNECFNVGSGIPINVGEVAQTLLTKYKSDSKVAISGNFRLGDIRHNYSDNSKVKKVLKFRSKVVFEEGIARFAEWVKSQKNDITEYDRAHAEMESRGILK